MKQTVKHSLLFAATYITGYALFKAFGFDSFTAGAVLAAACSEVAYSIYPLSKG